jgi:hypothetical protein
MTENPMAGKRLFGLPVQGSELPAAQVRRIGRLLMIAAPFLWLLNAAFCFGLFGPIEGIGKIAL